MPSGDGLLMRIKPFGGRLNAARLRVIARVAAECGNGVVELTSRGNIQLRGFSEASARSASDAMVEAGLADADPDRERRRNVIAVPPCDDALVATIENVLAGIVGLAAKFCVAVGDADADIVVRDGMIGANGVWAACSTRDVPAEVEWIARKAAGARLSPLPLREGSGERWGLRNPAASPPPPAPPTRGRRKILSLPFGQTDSVALLGLATLIGDAEIRTTPWRAFQIPCEIEPGELAALGFVTDSNDPRKTIAACPGAPACASGSTPTRIDATFLASLGLRDLHVSGCAKGCAHHRQAATLVGANGRYDLVRYGRAADPPDAKNLTIREVAEMLA
jgi:precorrin-3B synthase